ncbi:septum site-determining protein MinC [Chitiniphilus purpureus]|uniref:Probable septum site-determining protein MinC n=1 Tax=Chitiniphilus purpureus TaxID=2981137 RepID=A0ABY6DIQ0_9NEIS|nr:septum site-determining protein MinC [Chitiniphilus sp. CD1]UXY14118.1 septum site-determining protein MinC [Chitiniphilus sp. CD1]
MPAPTDTPAVFDFKSQSLKLLSFVPATLDCGKLEAALRAKLGDGEHMLSGEQLIVDFDTLPSMPSALEITALIRLLGQFGLKAVAARGGNDAQRAAARDAGLVVLANETAPAIPPSVRTPERPVPAMVVNRPVRTGQQVYARGGDLVVLALVSAGAEVIADGNIHVYAPLRGRALAGARGDAGARVFTTCLEAELVSINGVYRTLDEGLPASLKAKPAQVRLDQDKLVIEALGG